MKGKNRLYWFVEFTGQGYYTYTLPLHAGLRFQVGQTFWDFSSIMANFPKCFPLEKWSKLPQIFIHYGTFPNAFLREMKQTSSNFHPLWNVPKCFPLEKWSKLPQIFIHYGTSLDVFFSGASGGRVSLDFHPLCKPPKTPPPHSSVAKKHNKIFLKKFL
jgi:hypothetical protein